MHAPSDIDRISAISIRCRPDGDSDGLGGEAGGQGADGGRRRTAQQFAHPDSGEDQQGKAGREDYASHSATHEFPQTWGPRNQTKGGVA